MLRPFAHPVCCVRVGSCWAKFETGQTFSYVQTDAKTPNIVGSCLPTMLRPFAWDSRCLQVHLFSILHASEYKIVTYFL